jgi:hypothetical protein
MIVLSQGSNISPILLEMDLIMVLDVTLLAKAEAKWLRTKKRSNKSRLQERMQKQAQFSLNVKSVLVRFMK